LSRGKLAHVAAGVNARVVAPKMAQTARDIGRPEGPSA
jgi:hypothetical protein